MKQADWDEAQIKWLKQYPNLPVHHCPNHYTTEGTNLKGMSHDLVRELEAKKG
jgi:hypothetical protein